MQMHVKLIPSVRMKVSQKLCPENSFVVMELQSVVDADILDKNYLDQKTFGTSQKVFDFIHVAAIFFVANCQSSLLLVCANNIEQLGPKFHFEPKENNKCTNTQAIHGTGRAFSSGGEDFCHPHPNPNSSASFALIFYF